MGVLAGDPRLEAFLGQLPLEALVVSVRDGAASVEPGPEVVLSPDDRQLLNRCLDEALVAAERVISVELDVPRPSRPLSPANPSPHLVAARSNLDNGNPGRALEIVRAALERWPDNADLHTYNALALTALGNLPAAVRAYEATLLLDPDSEFAHAGAARLLVRLSRWEQARSHAQAGLKLNPGEPVMLHTLGLACEQLSRYHEAAQAVRHALEADSELPGARDDLDRIETALAQDEQVVLAGVPPPPPPDGDTLDIELIGQGDASEAEEAPQADPWTEDEAPAGDARWGTAAHRKATATTRECAVCGGTNPPRVAFCIHCGNRVDEQPES